MQATARREKRRLLDAQRGKCRVRLGSHLDEWCALKDHLGFAQHAQLAKFLLDSYISTSSSGASVPKADALLSVSLSSLKRLAFLCHQHGRDCPNPPTILSPSHSAEAPVLLWGCNEHQFHWNPCDGFKEVEAHLAVGKNKLKTAESLSEETDTQEKDSESVCMTGKQTRESQRKDEDQGGTGTCSQATDTGPGSVVSLSESDTTLDRSEENIVEQANGEKRLEVLVESIANEQVTISNEKTTERRLGQTSGIGAEEELTTLPAPTIEDSEKRHSERPVTQDIVVPDVEENCSINSSRKGTPNTPSGQSSRRQRANLQQSETYYKATTSPPQAALAIVCRRSPRGSKGSHRKAESKEQVSQTGAQCTTAYKPFTEEKEHTVGIAPETETNEDICPIEESIVEEVIGPNVSADEMESLATTEEPPMLEEDSSPSDEMIWNADDGSLPGEAPVKEPPSTESGDQQGSHSKTHKVTRLKPDVDEELAQISKKRIRKDTMTELLMCEYENCGKIFSKRQYLNYHQKYQHMNQRTFCCSVSDCGKSFNFKKHLKEHEKRHSDRRDFICEFCARAFRSSSNLIIHRRIHTGEKPLQCEFCGFTCRQKASLNWHMKKHDAAALYQHPCDICGQRFEKKDNLAAHKSRKHPEPREGASQPSFEGDTTSAKYSNQTEMAFKVDCQETLTELTAVSEESIKETVFPEYLELTESVQEAQETTQAAGNTEVSMVIVL
ncbi:zinc finger protein 692-like [Rana temporaria]|uniref:zinc finger protein 692-like n=1 Tax=Rana temporaria TaxID=8407 RepID=UPI001AAD58F9|nr:zinc finger protein 692-like [Rana temporaria]